MISYLKGYASDVKLGEKNYLFTNIQKILVLEKF